MADESIFRLIAGSSMGHNQQVRIHVHPKSSHSPRAKHNVDQIRDIMNPSRGIRDDQKRRGITPVDHAAANARAAKELSEINRLKRETATIEQSKPKVPKRYVQITSKVSVALASPRPESPRHGTFMRKNQGKNIAVIERAPVQDENDAYYNRAQVSQKPPVPSVYEAPALLPRTNKDFVRENFDKAPEFVKAVKTKATKEVARTEPLGAIPAYLVGRKKELEEAQEQARLARAPPSAPPGQRLVPEEERVATLDRLRCRMRELEGELARLPLTMRSLLSQQRRSAIEQGMEEVENAIRTFSKQKVFVVL